MSTTTNFDEKSLDHLQEVAKKHLWLHFTPHSNFFKDENPEDIPIIVKAEGHHVYTATGEKKIDGLAGLFTVQVGHGRRRLADAAHAQIMQLDYFPLWSYAHPGIYFVQLLRLNKNLFFVGAILLAEKLANYAPGDLNRVFFTTGGGEAVETAWKLAKQYFRIKGQSQKFKVISRQFSYHGTTQGALAITGIPMAQQPYAPLVPGALKVPNTCWYRAPDHLRHSEAEFGLWAANRIEEMIQFEGADSICAVFLEPLQNSGGCFTPPPGYFKRVRQICTKYNVLLVIDETITGFGRVGEMFASTRYQIEPDMICCAKGLSSGYAPIGALIVSDKLFEPFQKEGNFMPHGFTFGGHPLSCNIALENIKIIEEENLILNVQRNESYFRAQLETLYDIRIVGDVRGAGYFFGIELVKNKRTREIFNDEESHVLIRGFLSKRLYENGLYCRADDRGEPVVQLAPPLTITRGDIDEIVDILRKTLNEACEFMELQGICIQDEDEVSVTSGDVSPLSVGGIITGDSIPLPVMMVKNIAGPISKMEVLSRVMSNTNLAA